MTEGVDEAEAEPLQIGIKQMEGEAAWAEQAQLTIQPPPNQAERTVEVARGPCAGFPGESSPAVHG